MTSLVTQETHIKIIPPYDLHLKLDSWRECLRGSRADMALCWPQDGLSPGEGHLARVGRMTDTQPLQPGILAAASPQGGSAAQPGSNRMPGSQEPPLAASYHSVLDLVCQWDDDSASFWRQVHIASGEGTGQLGGPKCSACLLVSSQTQGSERGSRYLQMPPFGF